MAAIKKMVSDGLGITFMFEVAAKSELDNGTLSVINIPGFYEEREFNFVLLKGSFFRERYMRFYDLMKQTLSET